MESTSFKKMLLKVNVWAFASVQGIDEWNYIIDLHSIILIFRNTEYIFKSGTTVFPFTSKLTNTKWSQMSQTSDCVFGTTVNGLGKRIYGTQIFVNSTKDKISWQIRSKSDSGKYLLHRN